MPTYLDHAATTAVRPEARAALLAGLDLLGNPGSVHLAGQRARTALAEARESLARTLGAHPSEVIFVSGGTEANNLALKGLFEARVTESRRKILAPRTEHHAVLDPLVWLAESRGAELVWISQDKSGLFDMAWLSEFLSREAASVALITAMWVNNETGVINPPEMIGELASRYGIPFHSDAVAAVGHVEVDFGKSLTTTLALSGHKFGAPLGVGALLVRRDATLAPLFHGGEAERDLRSGTVSYPLAAALAAAAEVAVGELESNWSNWLGLSERLASRISEVIADARLSGAQAPRVPNIVNLTFDNASGESLLFLLDQEGFQVSNGSACTAGVVSVSHVLQAMGIEDSRAGSAIRLSFGSTTSEQDIDALLAVLPAAVEKARLAQK